MPAPRKNNRVLVFDEENRRQFLSGFRKRKLLRKKEAREKLERQLKEERRRLRLEAKRSYERLVVSHRPIPELETILAQTYDDDGAAVEITELSARRDDCIGENAPAYESDRDRDDDDPDPDPAETVPGMEPVFRTERDVKKALKKRATKNVQRSKAFQRQSKIETQKNRKKSARAKRERIKLRNRTKR